MSEPASPEKGAGESREGQRADMVSEEEDSDDEPGIRAFKAKKALVAGSKAAGVEAARLPPDSRT
jgi:hypothetical protein